VVIAIIAVLAAILFPVFGKAREKARQTNCLNNQRQLATACLMYAQDHEQQFFASAGAGSWASALADLDKKLFNCPTARANGVAATPEYGFNAYLYGAALSDVGNAAAALMLADRTPGTATTDYSLTNFTTDLDPRHGGSLLLACVDGHVESVKAVKGQAMGDTLTAEGFTFYDGLPASYEFAGSIKMNQRGVRQIDGLYKQAGKAMPNLRVEFDATIGRSNHNGIFLGLNQGSLTPYTIDANGGITGNPTGGLFFGLRYNGATTDKIQIIHNGTAGYSEAVATGLVSRLVGTISGSTVTLEGYSAGGTKIATVSRALPTMVDAQNKLTVLFWWAFPPAPVDTLGNVKIMAIP
jgi:type II secretory pathway pseudopilin PulG